MLCVLYVLCVLHVLCALCVPYVLCVYCRWCAYTTAHTVYAVVLIHNNIGLDHLLPALGGRQQDPVLADPATEDI